MLKKIEKWLDDRYEFTADNFKRNWDKGNKDTKFLLNLWKWMTVLAFFAGFTLSAGIYSQKVNDAVQDHIDDVNEYFYMKYGHEYTGYLEENNMSTNQFDLNLDLNDYNDKGPS